MTNSEEKRVKDILHNYAGNKSRIMYLTGEINTIQNEIRSVADLQGNKFWGGISYGNYRELECTEKQTNKIIMLEANLREIKKELAEVQKLTEKIVRGISCLDKRQREVLEKKFLGGMLWKEIAVDLNITERTCYRIYKRAVKQLASTMAFRS